MAEENEKKLSSKITGLKFMQRKQERSQRALLEKERERELRESQWVLTAGQEDNSDLIIEDLHTEPFKAGRRSYGGFNPLVEKLNQEVRSELARARGGRDESVSAKDMANRYTKYVKEGQTSKKRKVKSENDVTVISDEEAEEDNANPRSRKERRLDDEPPPLERPLEEPNTSFNQNSSPNNSLPPNSDQTNANPHERPRWSHGGRGEGGGRGRGGGGRGRGGGNQRPHSYSGPEGRGGRRGRGGGRREDGQFSRGRGGRDFRGGGSRGSSRGRGGEGGRGGSGFRRPVGDGL